MKKLVRCAVVSLGCPKNLVDSENMLGWLAGSGFELTTNLEEAEVIVVNTCGFLQAAVKESLSHLRKLAQLKRKGNCRVLVAAGCLISRFPDLVQRKVPEVDACLGVLELDRIASVVSEKLGIKLRRQEVTAEPPYAMRIVSTPPWYAYLKIAEGCDRTCSFCVIPTIRGKQKSRPMDELEAEAKELVEQGVRELILIAQDTTRYGVDLYGKPMLPDLIRKLSRLDGLKWLRLLYCYPTAVSERLIEAMVESEKVARYIDIPLQHSHPEILCAMQRGGDAESYARLIERLRTAMPYIAVRTTFIVGFPGETDKHFEHLLDFVKAMKFDRVGVFVFSPEPGTPAYKLPNRAPSGAVKRGEDFEAGALREAYEETGLTIRLKRYLMRLRVKFVAPSGCVDWTTHVFLAEPVSGRLCPIDTREIESARWVSINELQTKIRKVMLESSRSLLQYRVWLTDKTISLLTPFLQESN